MGGSRLPKGKAGFHLLKIDISLVHVPDTASNIPVCLFKNAVNVRQAMSVAEVWKPIISDYGVYLRMSLFYHFRIIYHS